MEVADSAKEKVESVVAATRAEVAAASVAMARAVMAVALAAAAATARRVARFSAAPVVIVLPTSRQKVGYPRRLRPTRARQYQQCKPVSSTRRHRNTYYRQPSSAALARAFARPAILLVVLVDGSLVDRDRDGRFALPGLARVGIGGGRTAGCRRLVSCSTRRHAEATRARSAAVAVVVVATAEPAFIIDVRHRFRRVVDWPQPHCCGQQHVSYRTATLQ